MKTATRSRIGVGLILLLVGIVLVSLRSLQPSGVPDVFGFLFMPGFVIAALFHGGNIHALENADVVVWNIAFWAVALGVPGIYLCFLAGRSTPGDLPPIAGAS